MLHRANSILGRTAVWKVIFGLTNLMKPIDASRCVENLFHFNYILLVLSKGKMVLSEKLFVWDCCLDIVANVCFDGVKLLVIDSRFGEGSCVFVS